MRYLAIECPAARETWFFREALGTATDVYEAAMAAADILGAADLDIWEAFDLGEHKDAGAASAAWAAMRENGPSPIARGQYRYDADGVAPVSVGVTMLEGGR